MTNTQLQQLAKKSTFKFEELETLHNSIPAKYQNEQDILFAACNPVAAKMLKQIKEIESLKNEYDNLKSNSPERETFILPWIASGKTIKVPVTKEEFWLLKVLSTYPNAVDLSVIHKDFGAHENAGDTLNGKINHLLWIGLMEMIDVDDTEQPGRVNRGLKISEKVSTFFKGEANHGIGDRSEPYIEIADE